MTLTATGMEAGTYFAWTRLPVSCRRICIVPVPVFVVFRAPWAALPELAICVRDVYDLSVLSKYAVTMLDTVAAPPQLTLMKP